MPRAKKLSAYPPILFEILERTGVNKERLDFMEANKQEALKMQGRFYALRQAIDRSIAQIKITSASDERAGELSRLRDLEKWASFTVCWLDRATPPNTPCRLSFMHRDQTPEALKYKAILDANPVRPLPARPAEIESQERLLRDLEPAAPAPGTGRRYY